MSNDPYPFDPVVGQDNVTVFTAALFNASRNALRYLANSLPQFRVDPDNADCYATINAAVAAADAALPAGDPISIVLAPGKTHTLTGSALSPPIARSIAFSVTNSYVRDGDYDGNSTNNTKIVGSITLAASDSGARRICALQGITLNGSLNIGSNWKAVLADSIPYGAINRTHGANGARLEVFNCLNQNTTMKVTDSDTPPSTNAGSLLIIGSKINWLSNNDTLFSLAGACQVVLKDVHIGVVIAPGSTSTMFDFNNAGSNCRFINVGVTVNFYSDGDQLNIFANQASVDADIAGFNVFTGGPGTDGRIGFGGSLAEQKGSPSVSSSYAPSVAINNTIWHDTRTGELLTWDGTYWGNNGTYRHDVTVAIGSAALEHDVGWDVPSGAAVVSRALKVLKTLTGAGGASGAGFGVGSGDPSRYGEVATLTADSHDEGVHDAWNEGSGDDLKITATDGGGTPVGTLAGSDDSDVLVRVRFRRESAL